MGLLTAVLIGLNPILLGKAKSKPIQSIIGVAAGAVVFGLIVFFCTFNQSVSDLFSDNWAMVLGLCFLSGVFSALAQFFQYIGLGLLGTGKGFALSSASILLFNSLYSVLVFHDWTTTTQLALGFSSIAIIIVGAVLVNYSDKKDEGEPQKLSKRALGIFVEILSGICFTGYAVTPRYITDTDVASTSTILPQTIGLLVTACLLGVIVYFTNKNKAKRDVSFETYPVFKTTKVLWCMIPGFLFGASCLTLVYSQSLIGTAVGYTLSQLCCVVSTILSFAILKEHRGKTKKELTITCIGVALVTIGCVLNGLTLL